MSAFLLSYPTFLKPIELFEKLVQRFCIVPPPTVTSEAQTKEFIETIQIPIRLRQDTDELG